MKKEGETHISGAMELVAFLAIYIGALTVAVATTGLIAWAVTKLLPL